MPNHPKNRLLSELFYLTKTPSHRWLIFSGFADLVVSSSRENTVLLKVYNVCLFCLRGFKNLQNGPKSGHGSKKSVDFD